MTRVNSRQKENTTDTDENANVELYEEWGDW